VTIIRPVDGLNHSFLRWFLASPAQQQVISTIQSGVTRQALTRDMILNFDIPLPPYGEQVRIVAKIDALFSDVDAGVLAVRRAAANLKHYRAGVLKAAVEGSLTADWRRTHPVNERGPRLLQRILAERRRRWEADQLAKFATGKRTPPKNWQGLYIEPTPPDISGLPQLPDPWCWVAVEQLGDVQLGRQRSPKHHSKEHPTQYIRAANLTERGLDLSDVLEMNFSPAERNIYRLSKGDVLLSEASGSPDQVGKPVVWNDELAECCFQNTVIRLRPTLPMSAFLLVVFRHCYFNKVFAAHTTGVGINHLSAARFRRIAVPLPPLEEQAKIVSEIQTAMNAIREGMAGTNIALTRAKPLKQDILRLAFEGKLVSQEPTDEPVQTLLERIRQQRAAAIETEASQKKINKRNGTRNMALKSRRPLLDVLKEHPNGLSPEDLLREAGYAITEVDDFYTQLRTIAPRIEEIRPVAAKVDKWPKGATILLRAKGK
jgi:type I restriction enzyme S subunit